MILYHRRRRRRRRCSRYIYSHMLMCLCGLDVSYDGLVCLKIGFIFINSQVSSVFID